MRDKNKDFRKFLLAIALVLSVLAIVPFMSAAGESVNISSPITWGNYTGTFNVSIFSNVINTTGPYNVSLYCNMSGGAVDTRVGSDISLVVTLTNRTASGQSFENSAVSISGLTDSLVYNCSAYADNKTTTGFFSGAVNVKSNITIDNTAPSCSMSTAIGLVYLGNPQTLVYSSADALSLVSTVVNISGPSSFGTTSLPTTNTNGYQLNSANSTYKGSYTVTIQALDRSGNVCTSTATWKVDTSGGSVTVSDGITGIQKQPNSSGILLVVAIVIVGILLFSKKK